ncbi:DNA polymerase I [Vibrio maritimus]|uniref:DNA polymerase I n=1 Tax=Vibrio maritimus TaxID=990268 RepID=A0A090S967_9VIBR|nr:DNA polymerase I [Vibrio maritimus]
MNIRSLKNRVKSAQFMYLWDRKAQFRYDLCPDYKGKRNDTPEKVKAKEDYHSQQPYIEKMLGLLGIPQVHHDGLEADDLGYYLALHYAKKGYEVVLVTSDKDWLQMVAKHENISWYDPRFDRSCNHALFSEQTGFATAEAYVDSKCLIGDKSDNIDGIDGLGQKASELVLAKWGSVRAMLAEHKALGEFSKENIGAEFGRYIKKLNGFCSNPELVKRYVRNRKLMDLSLAPKPENIQIVKTKKNPDGFFELCEELAFHSVIAKREVFENTFFKGAA